MSVVTERTVRAYLQKLNYEWHMILSLNSKLARRDLNILLLS